MGGSCEDFWNMWIIEDVGTDLKKKQKKKHHCSLYLPTAYSSQPWAERRGRAGGRFSLNDAGLRLLSNTEWNDKENQPKPVWNLLSPPCYYRICISCIKAGFSSSVGVWRGESACAQTPYVFFFFFFRSLFSRLTYSLSSTVLSLVAEAGVWQPCLSGGYGAVYYQHTLRAVVAH